MSPKLTKLIVKKKFKKEKKKREEVQTKIEVN